MKGAERREPSGDQACPSARGFDPLRHAIRNGGSVVRINMERFEDTGLSCRNRRGSDLEMACSRCGTRPLVPVGMRRYVEYPDLDISEAGMALWEMARAVDAWLKPLEEHFRK